LQISFFPIELFVVYAESALCTLASRHFTAEGRMAWA